MRKIPRKNYYIVVLLIVITVLITLFLSNLYKNRSRDFSLIYNYSNKITSDELDEYLLEMSDIIIYVADKYDNSNTKFEEKFKNKIDSLNLKDKLIYIDKSELNKKSLEKLNKEYKIKINLENLPTIITIVDRKVTRLETVRNDSDVNKILNYEDFE